MRSFIILILGGCMVCSSGAHGAPINELVTQAMQGDHRDPANVERDRYRHPLQTLRFLGLRSDMTAVEIWPGEGWYTEILAPVMRPEGIYYAAGFAMTASRTPQWREDMQIAYMNKLGKQPDVYDHVVSTELSYPERTTIAPPETADIVLTFRNVHNWMQGHYAPGMFRAFYRALKPGGILGLVEHRAKPGATMKTMIESGYVTERHIIDLARQAGFELEAKSEINANPEDTKDYPEGVWTLPPTLRLCAEMDEGPDQKRCDRKYRAIGESDRMTLRFRKPVTSTTAK